jgi:hypothetical protein
MGLEECLVLLLAFSVGDACKLLIVDERVIPNAHTLIRADHALIEVLDAMLLHHAFERCVVVPKLGCGVLQSHGSRAIAKFWRRDPVSRWAATAFLLPTMMLPSLPIAGER